MMNAQVQPIRPEYGGSLHQITCEPDGREGIHAKIPDDLLLAVMEDIAEMDGMIATWAITLHSLAWRLESLESEFAAFQAPLWWGGRRRSTHR